MAGTIYDDLREKMAPFMGGMDSTAIHVDEDGEIDGIDAKATPVTGDVLVIEDSEDSNAKKKITIGDLPAQDGADSAAIHDDTAGEIMAVTLKAAPVAADEILIEDSESDPVGAKKSATIGSLPIAQAQVASGIREIAGDGAIALADTDSAIIIADTETGTKAITTASSYPGQQISIRLVAATGNSYTLELADATTLTFDGAGEQAVIVRNAADTGWLVALLLDATIV